MAAWSFLKRLSKVCSAIRSRTVLPLPIQSLWLSDMSDRPSARCLSFSSSGRLPCSPGPGAARTPGRPICPTGRPFSGCMAGMPPFTSGTRLGGTALVLRGFGLWRLSSGGSSGFGNPFGSERPLACLPPGGAVGQRVAVQRLRRAGARVPHRVVKLLPGVVVVVVGLPRARGAPVLEAVGSLELPRGLDHKLDPVRPLVVDTSAANGLGKIPDHGPRHAGQVAQVAGLPPGGGDRRGGHGATAERKTAESHRPEFIVVVSFASARASVSEARAYNSARSLNSTVPSTHDVTEPTANHRIPLVVAKQSADPL
ncbi:hypothetical protein EYF80_048765 [Liparis tanakae]|uniref:Uncharacterized protein n=1 Tax=Liparis tanakae TaxID=230148 RepID=A0A4Z2FJU9_9TELE|nr:hypothetical protein EYF80_048765 [Liparis tanakae]